MDDREAMKKVADELRKGAQMQDFSCPICDFPALKNKKTGIIYCASCQREIKFADSKEEYKVTEKIDDQPSSQPIQKDQKRIRTDIISPEKDNLYKKIKYMSEVKLKDLYKTINQTQDLNALESQFSLVNEILETIYKLDKFFLAQDQQ